METDAVVPNCMVRKRCRIRFTGIGRLLLRSWILAVAYFVLSLNRLEADGRVRVFPAPDGETLSSRFVVTAEQKNVPVYQARVMALSAKERETLHRFPLVSDTSDAAFASFECEGRIEVSVMCRELIHSAKILPSSVGIEPVISGQNLTFTIAQPANFVLEVNGDWVNSLHLFANPIETDIPSPDDPGVIYFGPGIHNVECVHVGSGKTVYLAGGAVVYGEPAANGHPHPIFSLRGSNIVFRGRGVVDGSRLPKGCGTIIDAQGNDITLEGVVLRDSGSWSTLLAKSDRVAVENIKVIGWRANSDGIDICNSQNVTVNGCFIRTFDDLIVVKTLVENAKPSRDIVVKTCVLWNEFAHALSVGAELRAPVENVEFSNCDIIRDKGREWTLRIFHGDSAPVTNIVFDKIRIEESRRLISLWIGKTVWSKQHERGHVDDVTFRQISSVTPERIGPAVELVGADVDHAITNVRFDRVLVGGHPIGAKDLSRNAFTFHTELTPVKGEAIPPE
jgi:hypothetical protein